MPHRASCYIRSSAVDPRQCLSFHLADGAIDVGVDLDDHWQGTDVTGVSIGWQRRMASDS
jgi:hypothetical protein